MKRTLSFIAALFMLLTVNAQDANRIIGTWEIKSFQYGDQPEDNRWHTAFKKYKSYTPTHFTVTEVNLANNVTTTSIFGTYEFTNGVYKEHILHVNEQSAFMIGQTFSFTLSFDLQGNMHTKGSFNGMQSSEIWERVDKTNKFTATPPLYVIENGDEYIVLTFDSNKENPLTFVPQDQILSVEVLKDATATAKFNERGKNGVIIIGLKEEALEDTVKLLKSKGIDTETLGKQK